ncbi:MAG: hypothetical protein AAFZ15_19925 [Bacteroidota bacterium]
MNPKIKVTITTNELSTAIKEEMWELYRHYYFYDKAYFMQRTKSNTHFSFYRANGRLIGFTGLRINRTNVNGKRQFLVYFGQTVVHHDFRGKSLIPVTGAKLCMKFWKDLLCSNVYFWADALTYKAYLVFAKTVDVMYPSCKAAMPAQVKAIVDHLGKLHYPDAYCPATGTVYKEKMLVNDTNTQIPAKYQLDKDIRFYVHANPNFCKGHGLLTITPMNGSNVRQLLERYGQKMLGWKKVKATMKRMLDRRIGPAFKLTSN